MNRKIDFIIGGERRSGSTTLYRILAAHPQVNMYHESDMDYFIKNALFSSKKWYIDFDRDEDWYATHSKEEYLSLFEGLFEEGKIVGQKDADLLFWKPAHRRLKEFLPDTKFIFVLREPISRAESQYWNEFAKGRETLTFEEALKKEQERSRESHYGKLHLNYMERGKYIESIRHFREYFPDDQVLIVILEKLKSNPDEELRKIADFLNISFEGFEEVKRTHSNHQEVYKIKEKYKNTPVEKFINFYDRVVEALIVRLLPPDKEIRDAYRYKLKKLGKVSARSTSPMKEETKKMLADYYEKSNRELESFLNIRLNEWDIHK